MTASENVIRHCPKCGSVRVRSSRRRGPFEGLLTSMGGEICRCHDCCSRKAWFGVSPIPIGNRDPEAPAWTGILLIGSAGAAVGLAWWLIVRFVQRAP